MVSYWKTQWFRFLLGSINFSLAIYYLVQDNEFMYLSCMISSILWFITTMIMYNSDRIRALEKRVKELEDLKEKEKEDVTENNR